MRNPVFSRLRWHSGDWNGFWALFADNLANMVILSGVLIGIFKFDHEVVFGRILPGLGVALLFGLLCYVHLALRLAAREQRETVTALPYGISTPVMFVYLFAVIGPVYFSTSDALLAYRVGLAAGFIGGLVEMSGALVGPALRRLTPRAGMLGTLAGIALVWIAAVPCALIFENPTVGLPALVIILLGLIGFYRLPFGLPAGLVAIILGVAMALVTGKAELHWEATAWHFPVPVLEDLYLGLQALWHRPEILAVVLPLEIYNFIETMNNVESAKAAGDDYPTAACQVIDGLGTTLGAVFGSPFPTTVYIGHPAYKRLGARTSYALLVGVVFFFAGMTGVIAFLRHLIPEASVAPLLVFVGIVIAQQAFRATPVGHGVAVAFALIPHIADLLNKQLQGTILELRGPNAATAELLARLAERQGVHLQGYAMLSQGAILTGLLWGAIVAFLIDGKLRSAMLFSGLAFLLALFGLIHAPTLGFSLSPPALGYLLLTILLGLCELFKVKKVEGGEF
ncbi:MAG: solute carrier family 23 protein [candidate division KSB1 bacterium]|nr:solute carrier family 23 protein [candidate division KSB1 bacterium]MDZ7275346.1 solute carrier family 23 protein [candidate division KSB1 bacterium]MDZ7287513.1 solute carrier family 23 protein [candidate division KSB1 bacterium]MDZ7299627.1 solute carrier family 23 protein [candidate division KSB1 bacterium]MDZ7307420.1 solute carrier family 23 protein [candidate division KSB1 bacterium]